MSQHHDDGSFTGGFTAAIAIVLSFFVGYFIRDSGVTFNIKESQPVTPINRNLPGY